MVQYAAEFFSFSLGMSIGFDVPCRGWDPWDTQQVEVTIVPSFFPTDRPTFFNAWNQLQITAQTVTSTAVTASVKIDELGIRVPKHTCRRSERSTGLVLISVEHAPSL